MGQKILRLRKRRDFLAVREGEKRRGALFLLEVRKRGESDFLRGESKLLPGDGWGKSGNISKAEASALSRIGFTVTRKNGNAVKRNRIKRRLREAVRIGGIEPETATDYVIVARPDILTAPFSLLTEELRRRFKGGSFKDRRKDYSERARGGGNN